MLSKRQRLEKASFSSVFRRGTSKRTANFLVKFVTLPNREQGFAVVVPKTVVKKAVDRNRIKRRVFGAIEKIGRAMAGQSVIFVVKKDIRVIKTAELLTEVGQINRLPRSS